MNEQTKESKFLDAINRYAEKQKELMNKEVEDYKAKKLEQATESGLNDAYELIKRDIADQKAAIVTEYAKKKYSLRCELFRERERIADEIFSAAKERLIAFTETDGYREHLIKLANEAAEIIGSSPCTVSMRERDSAYADEIAKVLKKAYFVTDNSIVIGGIKVFGKSDSILIDNTIDSKLDDERRWFYDNSGFEVTAV